MSERITCIWDARAILGESPIWVAKEAALYWVDIKKPAVHRLSLETGEKSSWPMPEKIGCLVHHPQNGFLAGLESGLAQIIFGKNGYPPTISMLCRPEKNLPSNRFNDGKLDAQGRFWAGTMDDAEQKTTGAWWQWNTDGECRQIDHGYKVTNGPAFDPSRGRVYITDSAAQTIFVADLDATGDISNKQVFLQFGDGDGYPDGMTTDDAGNLWVAFWDGWCLRQFNPNAKPIRKIKMPIPRPTSITFASTQNILFVTSARIGLADSKLQQAPLSGGLFAVELVSFQGE